MVKDKMHDASESQIFICGMFPLDSHDPWYDLFQSDPSLDCDTRIEAEFYVSKIQPSQMDLYCHCADTVDSFIQLNTHLKAREGPYSTVLLIYKACVDNGCQVI